MLQLNKDLTDLFKSSVLEAGLAITGNVRCITLWVHGVPQNPDSTVSTYANTHNGIIGFLNNTQTPATRSAISCQQQPSSLYVSYVGYAGLF